jgi:enoyl-CoA hydratase/carnithine racemase
LFKKVETKVEKKVGVLYMNSEKDFNALSVEMKASLVKNIK